MAELPTTDLVAQLRDHAEALERIDYDYSHVSDIALWRRSADEIERLHQAERARANMTTEKELWTRLHNFGTGEWIRRNSAGEKLDVAEACVDALDVIHAQGNEIERLRQVERSRADIMDKGPWKLFHAMAGHKLTGIISEDFEHDVLLRVSGDFENEEQMKHYCEWLATTLNTSLIPIVSPSALCGLLGCTNQHVHVHDVVK